MKQLASFIAILLFLSSCANYKLHQKYNAVDSVQKTEQELVHSFYLVGNLARGSEENKTEILSKIEEKLSESVEEKSTVLFLGNHVSYDEVSEKQVDQVVAESLTPVIETIKSTQSNAIFIPGAKDWKFADKKGLTAQAEFIKEQLGKDQFYPKGGCPIKRINISEDIVLVIVDANWYIMDWDKHPDINRDCKITTRKYFLRELSDHIRQNRGKTTIVAMSHPLYSNGEYGGNFSAVSNLKPLPVLGNIKNTVRKTSGFSDEDLSNRYYNGLRMRLKSLAQQNDRVIIVSGHEKNLQYLVQNKIPQIISGSSTYKTPVKNTQDTHFSHGERGYAILNIFKDGSSKVEFYNLGSPVPVYKSHVLQPLKVDNNDYPVLKQDSIDASILTKKEAHKGPIYRFFIGKRYRDLYGKDLTAKVAYVDTLHGGLSLSGIGGGHQTESIHFNDSTGQHLVFRAMRKKPTQFMQTVTLRDYYMQDQLHGTVAADLVQDFLTGSYPFAALLTENLTSAVDLPLRKSKLYYVPKQKGLGQFNSMTGDKLYVFEDNPIVVQDESSHLDSQDHVFEGKYYNTYAMINHVQRSADHQIDEKEYVRARLFDMLIGDWDRHQDQWKWLVYKENGRHIYKPFPRDRDQAFSKLGDGFLAKFAYIFAPKSRIIENYSPKMKAVKQINKEPFPIDVAFMTGLTLEEWLEESEYIQTHLTDEVIDNAAILMPEDMKDQHLDDIIHSLKGRRDRLHVVAEKYYNLVAKYSKVMGRNGKDYFQIETLPNKGVEIKVFEYEDRSTPYFHRVYQHHDTKQIWIYGLADDDHFDVIGKGSRIKLILVGGNDNDKYSVAHNNKVRIYDFKHESNDLSEAKKHAQANIRQQYGDNTYDFNRAYVKNNITLPIIGINQDVGTQLGLAAQFINNTFKGDRSHAFSGSYYSATKGATAQYTGVFPEVIGRYGLNVDALYNSQNYATNFFGYGNESTNFQDSLGVNYNQITMEGLYFTPTLSRNYRSGWTVNGGLNYLSMQLKDSLSGFEQENLEISDYLYNRNSFLGANAVVSYSNQDYEAYPTNGFKTSLSLFYNSNLTEEDKSYFQIKPSISLYTKLTNNGKLVFATEMDGNFILGEDFEFFQAATIGGDNGMRGFRNQRFAGQHSYLQRSDLRYVFNRFKTFLLPMRLGLYSGYDYGRVWVKDDDSNTWHNSLGGGVLLGVADNIAFQLGYFTTSDDNSQAIFSTRFKF